MLELIMFLIIGMVIGIFSGFFGVGGGFILTPILLLSGYSPVIAIATSLLYTIGTSVSGVLVHFRLKNIQYKIATVVGLSGIAATQVAHPFVMFLEKMGWDVWLIPVFYLILLAYFAFSMLKKDKTSESFSVDRIDFSPSLFKQIWIGFFGGFISTSLGVGGGFVLVPLLITFLGMKPRQAVGTSLLGVLFMVSIGFITYAIHTPINYWVGAALITGALIGGQLGGNLTTYYRNKEIRKLLGALYIFTWISLVFKLLSWNLAGLEILIVFFTYLLIRFAIRFLNRKQYIKSQ
ncbi:hypothetical protein EDD68_11419 [Melghiribacillus thermohalophilus]|uniref:Probable membrane transporter protein n=1 Tax=Melghiribacillus thermohalophilus TaxID=1324956 RepID=A0A4R3MX58_9BACI|nr:sulfite exporter TauE/SafE family protein [Melghiribacillus thermohalophilus]TCT20337.1 hypothetical protein EDD68_11419 [Melghiribacillus thermohalophilus]